MTDSSSYTSKLETKLGFDRIRASVSDKCMTQYASDRAMSEGFTNDESQIRKRLLLTDEMRLVLMFEENFPTTGYIDCISFIKALQSSATYIDLSSLRYLRTMLQTLGKVHSFFVSVKDSVYPNLKRMGSGVECFPRILARMDAILDRNGEIKDTASDELYRIRKDIRDKEASISKRIASILAKAKDEGVVDSDVCMTIRDGKMLIPVPAASKKKIHGYVYDESSTGKTVFIEPFESLEVQNAIRELRNEEQREILRILVEFSDFIRPDTPDLELSATYLCELDFIMAKAQVALDMIAGMPLMSTEGEMDLRKARHPLLEKALKAEGREMVPLTIHLDTDKRIILISGPNAGGKSVCLKTAGLLQYMFQCGMPVPVSETSSLMVYDRIFVDIGDDQSLDNDLSTYSSFLSNMKDLLSVADEKTLVLIDELGSGTEPKAGGAIAEAILSELDHRGAYGVITTHYTNLKLYASNPESRVINGAMQFDSSKIAPLFRLEMGLPGNSFAFELARKMGLPENIVKDAEERAGDEFVEMERNLRKIAKSRIAIDRRLQHIQSTDKTLEDITERYSKELSQIKSLKKEIIDKATEEARDIVLKANATVENTIRTIKESQAQKEPTKEARAELGNFLAALSESAQNRTQEKEDYIERKIRQLDARKARNEERKAQRADKANLDACREAEAARQAQEAFRNAPLKVGEKVRVKSNAMVGEVIRVSGKTISITVGDITTKLSCDKVERITNNEYKAATKEVQRPVYAVQTSASITERKLNFTTEIDVRGQRVNEALDTIQSYLDDAIMLGVSSVRIIHGKGTGALREEIQKYARSVNGVESASDEHIQFGGSGVTVVTFMK